MPSARFVAGHLRQVGQGAAGLRLAPSDEAEQASQVLHGERFTVYDEVDGWAWGRNHTDGYVGYVRAAALGVPVTEPTHRVSALRSFVYPRPDLRAPPRDVLSLTTPVTVTGARDGWAELAGGAGWVCLKHLEPPGAVEPDIVATARRLLGVPYLWGGATPKVGLDCSGLTMIVYQRLGIHLAHFTGLQWQEGTHVGRNVEPGDLVFFEPTVLGPGHVGIYMGGGRFIEAPHTGDVVKIASLRSPNYALSYVGAVRPY